MTIFVIIFSGVNQFFGLRYVCLVTLVMCAHSLIDLSPHFRLDMSLLKF